MRCKTLRSAWCLLVVAGFGMAAESRAAGGVVKESAQPRNADRRPNVLFIAVDDLRPELGVYGNRHVTTPNIDRLAAQGTTFTRAYCQIAVCGPSRNSIMTGIHPDQLEIWGMSSKNRIEWRDERPGVTSLPEQFRNHGYRAIGFGKIYDSRNGLDREHSWDAFDEGWQSKYVRPENVEIQNKKDENGRPLRPAVEAANVPESEFMDGKNAQRAIEVIQGWDPSKPLFLAVGFTKPHLPFSAPQKFWDLYDREKLPLPDRTAPPEGHSEYLFSIYKEIYDYAVHDPISPQTQRELVHGYYACISFIDSLIGQVIEALKVKGMYENTMIVLWGDHGFKLGEYGEYAKNTNLELDARVPLIFRLPSNQIQNRGNLTESFVELVDVMPTLCQAAGIPIPESSAGVSLVPILKDPAHTVREFALTQFPRQHSTMAYSIRTPEWRYHETRNRDNGRIVAQELYRVTDKYIEPENLAEKQPEALAAHEVLLGQYLKSMSGTTWRNKKQDENVK